MTCLCGHEKSEHHPVAGRVSCGGVVESRCGCTDYRDLKYQCERLAWGDGRTGWLFPCGTVLVRQEGTGYLLPGITGLSDGSIRVPAGGG